MSSFSEQNNKTPLRSLWSWAMYDWANSGFAALVQTFVFAAYGLAKRYASGR